MPLHFRYLLPEEGSATVQLSSDAGLAKALCFDVENPMPAPEWDFRRHGEESSERFFSFSGPLAQSFGPENLHQLAGERYRSPS